MSTTHHGGAKTQIARSQVLRRFVSDSRAATMVEFALLAVPFFGLLGAIFEVAFVDVSLQSLQSAVTAAGRQIMIGQVQSQGQTISSATQFNATYICPQLPTYMRCSQLLTDVETASSFASADTSKSFYSTATKFCPGAAGSTVVVRVVYPLPSIFPLSLTDRLIGLANNVPNTSGWVHVLMATAVFKTEPYTQTFAALAGC